MPAKLKWRLVLLALNVVLLVLVFVTWRPPKAEVWLREPSVLNETWYGPALLILVPVLLFWVSRAVAIKPLRTAGYWLSSAAFLIAIYAVVNSRAFPNRGLPFNPDASLERPLKVSNNEERAQSSKPRLALGGIVFEKSLHTQKNTPNKAWLSADATGCWWSNCTSIDMRR